MSGRNKKYRRISPPRGCPAAPAAPECLLCTARKPAWSVSFLQRIGSFCSSACVSQDASWPPERLAFSRCCSAIRSQRPPRSSGRLLWKSERAGTLQYLLRLSRALKHFTIRWSVRGSLRHADPLKWGVVKGETKA